MERVDLRDVETTDLPFLRDMLYEAAIVALEVRALERAAVLRMPVIARYLLGWGRRGDHGVLAVDVDGIRLGAAWYRLYPAHERGHGILAWPDTPELTIGVRREVRGRGIGTRLLTALADDALTRRYRQLLLSVDPGNPAVRLYRRCGFQDVPTDDPAVGTSRPMTRMLDGPERMRE